MSSLLVKAWRVGFNKVVANKLLRQHCGYSPSEAKQIVDEIMEGREVRLSGDSAAIDVLALELQKIGAVVVVE